MLVPQALRARPKPAQPARVSAASIERALRRLAVAAERGYHVLLSEAEEIFAGLTGSKRARVFLYAGGCWRAWDSIENAAADNAATWPQSEPSTWNRIAELNGDQFVPVRAGSLAVLLEGPRGGKEGEHVAGIAAAAFDLALTACQRRSLSSDESDEIGVMQRLAMRILKSRNLQEILLLITHETKQLLGADICGIMLREGDAVVMQRCVGNFSADTASLRMQAGQGLAGRVFETKKPCHVEHYLESNLISKDFMHLARIEMVRSALGAPLLSQDDAIGVLEVWRRQISKFDERDTRRLVMLANLTSVAIENARLSQSLESNMLELAAANAALMARYEVVRASAGFQHELIRLLLEGKSLGTIAAKAAEHVDAEVLILDANFEIEGASPACERLSDRLREQIKAALRKAPSNGPETTAAMLEGKPALLQPVVAATERLGVVVLRRQTPLDQNAQLALSQICIVTSLHLIERRAAARARAETLGAVLWDLLEGTDDVRRSAAARARDLRVDLEGGHRVFLCALDGIEQQANSEGWSPGEISVRRRRIAQTYRTVEDLEKSVKLSGARANFVALVCGGEAVRDAERLGAKLAAAIAANVTGLSVQVGISTPCIGPASLSAAYREAKISLEVARQRGRVAAACYEDAGIVGMLLSLRAEADVKKVVHTIFGPLLEEKAQTRDLLFGTLKAFFELNCSRRAAAKKLRVHEKTIVYRLAKIESLTGLDFSKHEKRLLADIALQMYGMSAERVASGLPWIDNDLHRP